MKEASVMTILPFGVFFSSVFGPGLPGSVRGRQGRRDRGQAAARVA